MTDQREALRALDDVLNAARRTYVRPAGQADSEDVWLADIITDIEKHVRQVVTSRLALPAPQPEGLDVDIVARVLWGDPDGPLPERGQPIWQHAAEFAAEYARLAGGSDD